MREPRTLLTELRRFAIAWACLSAGTRRSITNYGDELNRMVLEEATGRKLEWTPLGKEDVVAIGSILVRYFENAGRGLVWGSGLHTLTVALRSLDTARGRFLSVRGPHSRAALSLDPELPLGDPGLLVRSLTGTVPASSRRSSLLVPHYTAYNFKKGRKSISALEVAGFRVVQPNQTPGAVVRQIRNAEHVISSGLHEVILSHALKTPVNLITLNDEAGRAPAFKYADYAATVGTRLEPVPWHCFLAPNTFREEATAEDERIFARIDLLVDSVRRSSAPLGKTPR